MRYLPTEISVALKSHKFSTFYELTDHAAWLEGNASGKRNVPVYAMYHKKDSGVNDTHGRKGVHFANQKHEWRRHKTEKNGLKKTNKEYNTRCYNCEAEGHFIRGCARPKSLGFMSPKSRIYMR